MRPRAPKVGDTARLLTTTERDAAGGAARHRMSATTRMASASRIAESVMYTVSMPLVRRELAGACVSAVGTEHDADPEECAERRGREDADLGFGEGHTGVGQ